MSRLTSVDTPRAVAVWLSTNPGTDATAHAFDQLVDQVGHDQAMRTWVTGMRIARSVRGRS